MGARQRAEGPPAGPPAGARLRRVRERARRPRRARLHHPRAMITLRPATLETVKPLRLRALREDPDSFGSTLAREQDRPDAEWDFWVRDSLIAFDGDTPVGMANLK